MSEISEKILAEVAENPSITASELAEKFKVSRQYISLIKKANNIKLRRSGLKDRSRVWTNHFGGEVKLSSHFIGGASELTAAADLLRRGVPVYRALTFVGKADLIADFDDKLLRIEVKSAKRYSDGGLRYGMPVDKKRYDVLALVEPSGVVTYKPDVFAKEKY